MNPLISVIIPTYNRPRLLTDCLSTIAQDPYKYKEVIIVNDAGQDVSAAVEPFGDKMKVQILQLPTNRGHVHARNVGLQAAEGDMIMLCDDDDIMLPGHIDRMARSWMKRREAFFYSDAEIVVYDHAHGGRHPVSRTPFAFDFRPDLLRQWNLIILSGATYAHTLHEEIGVFDEDIKEHWDWDFLLRVSGRFPLRRIPVADVLYMVSSLGQNQSANATNMSRSLTRLIQKHELHDLPVSSFALMTKEPALKKYRRPTRLIWDGALPI